MRVIVLISCLMTIGCASKDSLEKAKAPPGPIQFCEDNPEHAWCDDE